MKLIVIGSNSKGNSYALDAGDEILLLEAGINPKEIGEAIGCRLDKAVGCICTHRHGDHFKFAGHLASCGIKIYGPSDAVGNDKTRDYHRFIPLEAEQTIHLGNFDIVPFDNYHDVPIFGYIIRHKDMGTMLFSTDSYRLGMTLRGIKHFLIEANYSDDLLKQGVRSGAIHKAQADRIMMSHMSLEYCIKYLRDCEAYNTAKTITLCHLSSRNSNPQVFRDMVAGAFGIPTYIAEKGTTIDLTSI